MVMSPSTPEKQRRPISLAAFVFFSLICGVFYGRRHHPDVHQNTVLNKDVIDQFDVLDPFDTYANISHLVARDDYSCTKDQPCKTEACCGGFFGGKKGTCGFGPNFCGKDCASNCKAKSECGANANPPGKTCPLNVCCSEFGFCGTTTDFCGKGCQSNCGKVQVPAGKAEGGVLQKVIGYYEAWSARWTCHTFPPSLLPVDGLTHVNFAFAGIDPSSFKITTMDPETPESLFMETADVRTLKSGNLDLQVFASIGGWTFSDNNTKTQPVFGNIAKNEDNRQKFADNVVSFMKEFGFDGVDIDWEYPGAPDRGGHEDDTKNYVALMKTMKDTFDKEAKGKYGLTFTVPTSYWYLRWFDLPGMLKHADWVNVMSYDLHGAWDMDNPIGNIVQGHTNLTEIKLAVELLWRNHVQPKQVVLGFGFYGRAFQLEDVGCSKVGCKFKAAASPGPCTDGAGTLAYFEIQDIIKDQKPNIIHDKEAAVNYFAYTHKDAKRKRSDDVNNHVKRADGKDQWVSFDDKTTMKQKVDWANQLGLGGSMVWSVDQDDDNFSALEGLTGRKLDDFSDELKKSQVTDTGHWSSLNGQKCKLSDCGNGDQQCDPGFAIAPGGQQIKDNCGGAGGRIVCCPVDSMPTACQWRGGETTKVCHGQCHTGESTLFHSRHATVACLRPGFQAFCCEATSFTALIAACKWTGCQYTSVGVPNKDQSNTTCGPDTIKVASKFDFTNCALASHISQNKDYNKDLCCPKDSAFENCHWVGKGTCDDNECSATDVEVDRDPFGQGRRCAGGANNREKTLCCNTPKNLNPFLPASLDKLFPTLPPLEDLPKYDLSITGAGSLGSDGDASGTDGDANHKAFGFLVLDGPSGAVQTLRKRDGSHWHIVSCEPLQEYGATLQIVCMKNEIESNCRDIHEGGVEGTVVAMPEQCGPGSYAVVHSIQPSLSQELPSLVKRAVPSESMVYDIELSYDFSLVKRDAGDIFIRLDYSNMNGYWENIVQADAIQKRSLDKRFWSKNLNDWKSIINGEGSELGLRQTGIATPSMQIDDVNALLIGAGKNDECKSDSDDGFLSVKVTGKVDVRMRFGFTFVGTISPNFHLEEAYGFFDSAVEHDGVLEFDGRGKLSMQDETFKQKSILPSPLTAYGYSHPGIISLGPELDIQATVIGEGEIDGKFSAEFTAGNGDTFTTYNQPKELGDITGGPGNNLPENAFQGEVTSKVTNNKPSRKAKRAAGDSTPFAMSLIYKSMMRIDLNQYGLRLDNANITFNQYVDSYVRLQGDSDGGVKVTSSNQEAAYDFESTGELPSWGQSTDTILLGKKGTVYSLYDDNKAPAKRDAPNIDGTPIFDSKSAVSCSAGVELECVVLSKLSDYDPTLGNDPETGEPYNEDEPPDRKLRRDGGGRTFTVTTDTGSFTMRSPTYPAGRNGAVLGGINPQVGHYGLEDPLNCDNTEVTDNYQGSDTGAQYVTEHILELNYFPQFVQFAITGRQQLPGRRTYTALSPTVDENVLNPQSDFWRPYSDWDHALGDEHPGSPVDRIWQVFGSRRNFNNLVNTERNLNSIKALVWAGDQPMADDTWIANGFNRAGNQPEDISRLQGALSFLRTVQSVFSYLNYQTINNHLGDSTTDMLHELETFSDRYNAVHNTNIDLGTLHREYLHAVLVPRLEGVREWLTRRLTQLQTLWRNQDQQTPGVGHIEDALESIDGQLEDVKGLEINSNQLPSPP